jgi:hypothetical protein
MGEAADYVGNVSTEVQRNQSLKVGGSNLISQPSR